MPIAHIMATGMGGLRGAGDLVAWMQMTRKMKLPEAKRYVAEKLGVSVQRRIAKLLDIEINSVNLFQRMLEK